VTGFGEHGDETSDSILDQLASISFSIMTLLNGVSYRIVAPLNGHKLNMQAEKVALFYFVRMSVI
jgi:hypothetical protein